MLKKLFGSTQRLAASLGIFVAPYQENFRYVNKSLVMREKIVPKKPAVAPTVSNWNALDQDKFAALAEKVLQDGRTYLAEDRLFTLWQAVRNVYRFGCAAAEVGSFRGGSAYFIASAFQQFLGKEVAMHIFDTFEGHPDKINPEFDPHHTIGKFSDTNYETVKGYLSVFKQLEVHKGEFSSSIQLLPEMQFGLVHIDVDIYQTTMDCLAYFAPRMIPGGVIILDDYSAPTCPGVDKAAKEFLAAATEFRAWHPLTEQLILEKI